MQGICVPPRGTYVLNLQSTSQEVVRCVLKRISGRKLGRKRSQVFNVPLEYVRLMRRGAAVFPWGKESTGLAIPGKRYRRYLEALLDAARIRVGAIS